VTLWRNLLVLTVLPGLAAAADSDMMNLVMPDASMLMEINVARIMASPVGSAMKDAFHQGLAAGLQTEIAKAKPEIQEQIAVLGNIDWSQEVQDVLIAHAPGQKQSALVLVRTSLDLSQIKALNIFSGGATEYEGVLILASAKPEDGVVALVDGSIVAIGKVDEVKAAIHRRGQPASLSAALAAQVNKYSQDDIWVASTETIKGTVIPPSAAKSPLEAQMAQFVDKVAGLNGGLRLSPDFDLSADLEARTAKSAAEIFEGLRSVVGMVQAQSKNTGGHGLEGLTYQMSGKHILLALHVPEAQMRAGLEQLRTAQARQAAMAVSRPPVAARQAPVVPPSSGLPPPPAGTLRVQSSEGTRLIQLEKQQ
jgi:hypothetical protein